MCTGARPAESETRGAHAFLADPADHLASVTRNVNTDSRFYSPGAFDGYAKTQGRA